MTQLIVNNGDTGLASRNKINDNFTEVYANANAAQNTANLAFTTIGVAKDSSHLSNFTGTTIPDNNTVKQALQALETAVEARILSATLAANSGANTIFTTTGNTVQQVLNSKLDCAVAGVANGAANMGTFTGSIITDNSTIKQALQDLEITLAATSGLSNTGVAAGTYGNSSYVGTFTVTQTGVITAASNVQISIPASQVVFTPSGNVSTGTVQLAIEEVSAEKLSVQANVHHLSNFIWDYSLGGPIIDHYANVGNQNTTETDLYSENILGDTFFTNGDKVDFEYAGTFLGSGSDTRRVRLYFGESNIFDSTALSISANASWVASGKLIRATANNVRYMVTLTVGSTSLQDFASVGEVSALTLTANTILKITGTSAGAGAANNDIVATMGTVEFKGAAPV